MVQRVWTLRDERQNPRGLEAETKGGERDGGAKRGVECGGQSIIKPALSLLGSVNEGRGGLVKRKKKKKKGGCCLRTDYENEIGRADA